MITNDQWQTIVIERGYDALTDEQVKDKLETLTAFDPTVKAIHSFLANRNLWEEYPEGMSGALENIRQAADPATKALLNELYSGIFRAFSETVSLHSNHIEGDDLTAQGVAEQFHLGWSSLVAAGALPQATMDDFYELGGGLMFEGITEQNVIDARAAYQASLDKQANDDALDALLATIANDFIEPGKTNGDDVATVTAAIKAGL